MKISLYAVLLSAVIAATLSPPAGQKARQVKNIPYYLCHQKGCDSYRKSIPRKKIEGEFEDMLKGMQPSKKMFELVKRMFKNTWIKWSTSKAR
nr:hypothetical protein [uncultured Cohaesibacter sp.]